MEPLSRDSGMGAAGKVDESHGNIKPFREAFDKGEYIRVGELSPKSSQRQLKEIHIKSSNSICEGRAN